MLFVGECHGQILRCEWVSVAAMGRESELEVGSRVGGLLVW